MYAALVATTCVGRMRASGLTMQELKDKPYCLSCAV